MYSRISVNVSFFQVPCLSIVETLELDGMQWEGQHYTYHQMTLDRFPSRSKFILLFKMVLYAISTNIWDEGIGADP